MPRFEPNFFDDDQREPWTVIRFGSGSPIKASLTKIDGVSTEYKWKKHKAKEKSGSANVYEGKEYKHPKLTFVAVDEEEFDDLRALWDLMQPVPGQGTGTAAATPAPGSTFAIGSPAKADSGGSAPSGGSSGGGASASGGASTATDPTDTKKDAKSKDPDPGPRPPTIAVHYPALAWHDIFACALVEWEGPTPTETNGLEVVITIIPDKPPVPAGTGVMAAPAPGSQFAGGAAGNAGGGGAGGSGSGTPQEKVDKDGASGAAGV